MSSIVFFNIGWMREYHGNTKDDKIQRGGAYVNENKIGFEIYNFQEYENFMYGYAGGITSVDISKLGAEKENEFIDNVLVVWVASRKRLGRVVVGWYKNATVYQNVQLFPERPIRGRRGLYIAKAKANQCTRLGIEERVLQVPSGKNAFGQKNIWYAKNADNTFIKNVYNLVNNGKVVADENLPPQKGYYRTIKTANVNKRLAVEKNSIKLVEKHFIDNGYWIKNVERDNVGWDLTVRKGKLISRVEVKGLSGKNVNISLTPNEFSKMKQYKSSYKICVVTNAIDRIWNRQLHIFSYNDLIDAWQDNAGNILNEKEILSAQMYL